MNKEILEGFPYSKEEFGNICATLDVLIMNVYKNASQRYSSIQALQVLKGYQSLKYPLLAVWEYYGFGKVEEIMMPYTSTHLYQAFKVDTIDTLNQIIKGIASENPFNLYGTIKNSDKVVEKLLIIYKHLLNNLKNGRIHF